MRPFCFKWGVQNLPSTFNNLNNKSFFFFFWRAQTWNSCWIIQSKKYVTDIHISKMANDSKVWWSGNKPDWGSCVGSTVCLVNTFFLKNVSTDHFSEQYLGQASVVLALSGRQHFDKQHFLPLCSIEFTFSFYTPTLRKLAGSRFDWMNDAISHSDHWRITCCIVKRVYQSVQQVDCCVYKLKAINTLTACFWHGLLNLCLFFFCRKKRCL